MHMMLRVQRCLASQAAMGGEDADLLGELAMEPPPEQATATGSASGTLSLERVPFSRRVLVEQAIAKRQIFSLKKCVLLR